MHKDIRIITDIHYEGWDGYLRNHPKATFFHLSGWQRVLKKTFPYRPYFLMAERGGRICGVFPLCLVKNLPLGCSLVSVPLGVYGGVCADDAAAEVALLSHAKELARNLGVRYMELRNLEPADDLPVKDLYVTFRKEISPNHEENLNAIPRKQRRMIRQGEKHGLSYRIGGREFLGDFYKVYSHSVRNLGTPVFPFQLFENLLAEFGESCRILGVFRDGKMVAGVMTFFFREQVMPYYGGALKEAFQYAVNDFMYWSLMCYGAEQGYKVFDFGRSKKGTGSYDFKKHWGFEPAPLAYQYHLVKQKEMPDMNPLNPKLSLPIKVWKQLPLEVTNWLGPKIVRFFP